MKPVIRLSLLGILVIGVGSCSLFDYSNLVSNKFAFVYGVTTYSVSGSPGSPNLSFPHVDASAVATLLTAQGYTVYSRWVDDTGKIYVNGAHTAGHNVGSPQYSVAGVFSDPGYATNDAPTQNIIVNDITSHAAQIGQNDTVVVYFSGHGTQDTSVSPPHEYFDPYEGVAYFNDTASPGFYADVSACVRDDQLAAAFASLKTPRKVLILDTCFSGGFIGNQLEADWTPPLSAGSVAFVSPATLAQAIANYASMQSSPTGLSPYGAQVLSGAGQNESDYEMGPPFSHGIMTYFLLQGLQGPADLNNDRQITVLEAFAYAKAGIEKNWNPTNLAAGAGFEPHVSGGPVDFVLF